MSLKVIFTSVTRSGILCGSHRMGLPTSASSGSQAKGDIRFRGRTLAVRLVLLCIRQPVFRLSLPGPYWPRTTAFAQSAVFIGLIARSTFAFSSRISFADSVLGGSMAIKRNHLKGKWLWHHVTKFACFIENSLPVVPRRRFLTVITWTLSIYLLFQRGSNIAFANWNTKIFCTVSLPR